MKVVETDPFFNTDNCVNRLLDIYEKNPRLIIAVDFDDTIFDFHEKGYLFSYVEKILQEAQKLNFYIVAFTASPSSRFGFIKKYFLDKCIRLDAINENVINSPFGNSGKIFYNLLLDDRAGLGQSYDVLKKVIEKIKSKMNKEELKKQFDYIGVDFDRTLAYHDDKMTTTKLGDPIPLMLERVKRWIAQGIKVKIFTARVAPRSWEPEYDIPAITKDIQDWCEANGLPRLEVTCIKDAFMREIWDDKAVRVLANEGKIQ